MNADMTRPGAAPALPTRKRRWWWYALIAMGGMFCLAILGVLLAFAYYRSLLNTYTSTSPQPVPKVAFDTRRQKELEAQWKDFALAIRQRQPTPPFVITADDINHVLSQNKELRGIVGFTITNGQVLAQFSAPLDKIGAKALRGRYVNGTAKIKLAFDDGWLSATIGSVDANGKPLPGWLLSRLPRENLLKDLERNRDMVNLMHEMQSVRVVDDKIVLTPLAGNR
jgi:hypothetical protein